MAEICSCCGRKISFLDVGFDFIEIDKKDYKICSTCSGNFAAYKSGDILLEELVSSATELKLKEYFKQYAPDGKVYDEIRRQEQRKQRKLVAQENDPLYDDIHQIAGDLRFIKNLIIIGLVCGFVLGLIGVFSLM